MACIYDPTDPQHLTPHQRLDEVATIMAVGIRRALALRAVSRLSGGPQLSQESDQNGLDVWGKKSVHVARPVNATGDAGRS